MTVRNMLLVALLATTAGCSTESSVKRPPETYFSEAQKLYAKGKYEQAVDKLKKVKESYRSPVLTTAAELLSADAQFGEKNYIEAASEYETFVKLHPDNPKAPYALFRAGLSHLNQAEKIDIDQTPVKNAVASFERFQKEYPDSELKRQVEEKLKQCRVKESEYEIYVGRFYYRTNKYASAITRLTSALEKYPNSPANDKALYYLGRSYLDSGQKTKGKEALQQLTQKYKNSEFSDKARKILGKTA